MKPFDEISFSIRSELIKYPALNLDEMVSNNVDFPEPLGPVKNA